MYLQISRVIFRIFGFTVRKHISYYPSNVILYLFQLTTWNGVIRKRKYLRKIGYAPKKMAASLCWRVGQALKALENIIALAFGKQFPPRK
jgi:hypothetical protein